MQDTGKEQCFLGWKKALRSTNFRNLTSRAHWVIRFEFGQERKETNMSTATARIKLQVWEWIPDTVDLVSHVVVYDPDTIMPEYVGVTNIEGYLEFDVDPGMYVIWIYGHNPMGYRPFLSDTWIPIAVLPGETKEVCAALVSLIDIPALYDAVRTWTHWEPETFAELLGVYAQGVLEGCNATAMQQRTALLKEMDDLKEGKFLRLEEAIDVRGDLLVRRREWAKQAMHVAKEHGREAVALAKEAGREAVEAMMRRIEVPLKAE